MKVLSLLKDFHFVYHERTEIVDIGAYAAMKIYVSTCAKEVRLALYMALIM